MRFFLFSLKDFIFYPHISLSMHVNNAHHAEILRQNLLNHCFLAINPFPSADMTKGKILTLVSVYVLQDYGAEGMLVVLKGHAKVKVNKVFKVDEIYDVCEGLPVAEKNLVHRNNEEKLIHLRKMLFFWLKENVQNSYQLLHLLNNLNEPENVVAYLSMFLLSDQDVQQWVLEFNNIDNKINALHGLLHSRFYYGYGNGEVIS